MSYLTYTYFSLIHWDLSIIQCNVDLRTVMPIPTPLWFQCCDTITNIYINISLLLSNTPYWTLFIWIFVWGGTISFLGLKPFSMYHGDAKTYPTFFILYICKDSYQVIIYPTVITMNYHQQSTAPIHIQIWNFWDLFLT